MKASFQLKSLYARSRQSTGAIIAAVGILFAGLAWAETETLQPVPLEGGSFTIGVVHGVGYYTVRPEGYHVVLTLTKGTEKPIRFEATLDDNQSVTLSSPRLEGERAESIVVRRAGDAVVVTKEVDAPAIELEE